ncbi:MAG: DamX protein [Psychromonas sp.]|jgi:DamX protein|uniref:AAA family ATPase n=1 Tax=Psychromonas sp. TaxID=1884585 RepID=UPI0039E5649A
MVERQLISLPSQLQLIDRLQHLIYLSSSLIFVSGEQGSGKSTLIEQLSNKLPGDIQQVFIQLNDKLSDSKIREKIIMQLYKQPLFDAQDSLFTSMSLLQEKQNRDVPRLIILDHADYLSADLLMELREIIVHKEQFGESDINVLLLASENDNHRMRASINAARVDHDRQCACLDFKLEALTNDEATSLLNHIFKQEQYQPKIQHQDALQKQLTACAGIPQKIITLAEQISAGEFEDNELSWLKIRLPAILLMFFLLITVAGLANYLYPKFFKPLEPAIEIEEIIENETVLLEEISETQLVTSDAKEVPELVEKLAGNWSNKTTTEINDNQLAVGISDASVERVVISDQDILNLTNLEKEPATDLEAIKETQAQPIMAKVEIIQSEEKSAEIDASLDNIQQVSEPESAIAEMQDTAESEPETKNIMLDNIERKAEITPQVKNENEVIDKEQSSIFTAPAQLLAVAPAHFTLQLSGFATEESFQQFVSAHNLPQPSVYIYRTIRNNKPWYVVIFGDYDSLLSAKKASKTLPGSLANMDVWIKKYQLVHQDLRLNNE